MQRMQLHGHKPNQTKPNQPNLPKPKQPQPSQPRQTASSTDNTDKENRVQGQTLLTNKQIATSAQNQDNQVHVS
jgi:hypothetical protein